MGLTRLTVDGQEYKVRLPFGGLQRGFNILEGPNAGTARSGRNIRDILGTAYSYSIRIEPDPAYRADYDALYEALCAPVDSHILTVPYGQETRTFEVQVSAGSDTYHGQMAGQNQWTGLEIDFSYAMPVRT